LVVEGVTVPTEGRIEGMPNWASTPLIVVEEVAFAAGYAEIKVPGQKDPQIEVNIGPWYHGARQVQV
jgi:hypothetical protein